MNQLRPTCDCGKEGSWHGDLHGQRMFMCGSCWQDYEKELVFKYEHSSRSERKKAWADMLDRASIKSVRQLTHAEILRKAGIRK